MKFTNKNPDTWRDLQNLTAKYLEDAGYEAITPYEIETVRGKVEVDVFVKAPYELVKTIICECKFWNTPVTKEKIHAFRTVIHDSGAGLGIIVSKNGYQSGAIEAAKYSNIKLDTWDSFLDRIFDKWISSTLRKIKLFAAPLQVYTDPLDFPIERLSEEQLNEYKLICSRCINLWATCWMMTKDDLLNSDNQFAKRDFYHFSDYDTIDAYLEHIQDEVACSLKEFESICLRSDILIPEEDLKGKEGVILMYQ